MSDEAWVSWSCGKDSALALAKVRTGGGVGAVALGMKTNGPLAMEALFRWQGRVR